MVSLHVQRLQTISHLDEMISFSKHEAEASKKRWMIREKREVLIEERRYQIENPTIYSMNIH